VSIRRRLASGRPAEIQLETDLAIVLAKLSPPISDNPESDETSFETHPNVISETDVISLVISFRPLDGIVVIEVEVRAIHSSRGEGF